DKHNPSCCPGDGRAFRNKFFPAIPLRFIRPKKISPLTPGHLHRAVLVYALAANGSQTGEGYIQGQVQQVPAQSQNRGPGNSTGDG
uniref:hypothetical protein n=1 Tax=Klebsiella pneumoniae TaxID=573 RepID=UPI001CFD7BD7